jgi:predicted RNase H-like HicB family nuclease
MITAKSIENLSGRGKTLRIAPASLHLICSTCSDALESKEIPKEAGAMPTYRFSVVIEKDKEGYFAFSPELQGCYTQGTTYEETLQNIKDAITLHVKDRVESGSSSMPQWHPWPFPLPLQ